MTPHLPKRQQYLNLFSLAKILSEVFPVGSKIKIKLDDDVKLNVRVNSIFVPLVKERTVGFLETGSSEFILLKDICFESLNLPVIHKRLREESENVARVEL